MGGGGGEEANYEVTEGFEDREGGKRRGQLGGKEDRGGAKQAQ